MSDIDPENLQEAARRMSKAFRAIASGLAPAVQAAAKACNTIARRLNLRKCNLCGGLLLKTMKHRSYVDCMVDYPSNVAKISRKRSGRKEMLRRLAL